MTALRIFLVFTLFSVAACATGPVNQGSATNTFEEDRKAILAMAGDYKVTFDFTETVPFVDGYALKKPYITGGDEVVRVIADDGNFISLQHILVVGGDAKMPVKHWRQDWIYEPEFVFEFIGKNKWQKRALSLAERRGKWAQLVYQVDDGPRYAGVSAWHHENGVSAWTSPASLRPLPRRDATKRDDYDAILAVNRHAITPAGWVHEQDNSKLIMAGTPQILVREVAVNTYAKSSDFDIDIADDYWAATKDYWANVREVWTALETDHAGFGLTIQGEPEELYMQLLELADNLQKGKTTVADASAKARDIIGDYTFTTSQTATGPEPLSSDRLQQHAAR